MNSHSLNIFHIFNKDKFITYHFQFFIKFTYSLNNGDYKKISKKNKCLYMCVKTIKKTKRWTKPPFLASSKAYLIKPLSLRSSIQAVLISASSSAVNA